MHLRLGARGAFRILPATDSAIRNDAWRPLPIIRCPVSSFLVLLRRFCVQFLVLQAALLPRFIIIIIFSSGESSDLCSIPGRSVVKEEGLAASNPWKAVDVSLITI